VVSTGGKTEPLLSDTLSYHVQFFVHEATVRMAQTRLSRNEEA
jgi:hypothetical protein